MTRRSPPGSLRLSAAALAEAKAAARSFEARRAGLGKAFESRLDDTLHLIEDHPESYQRINDRYRRAFLAHFPFVVVYRMLDEGVEVVGVLPTRADPTVMDVLTSPMVG